MLINIWLRKGDVLNYNDENCQSKSKQYKAIGLVRDALAEGCEASNE